MPLFYQRGDILHFSRSFSIFRQGSCLISLYPIFSPSFSEFSLSFPSLSSPSNPVSSISCDVPEFSPSLLSRTLEKGAFLQSAVTVSSSIASQKLYRSSTAAPSYSCYAGLWLPNKPAVNLLSIYLPPEGNTITVVLHSTTPACIPIAYSLLNNRPERPIAYTLYKPPTHCFYPPHFHILPAIPRIRLRMLCTGFSYSHGIISHLYVKIDYSSNLPPERKWFFNGRRTSPYLLCHSCVSTH